MDEKWTEKRPFDSDPEDRLREESLRLLKDESVNWSMLVLMAGMRLSALANMVLKRTLDEEQASKEVHEYIVESAKAKARSGTDLTELATFINDFVPPYLQEEISRRASADHTQQLVSAARRHKKAGCKVAVQDKSGIIKPGEMLVLLGDSEKVANAIDELLGVPQCYRYENDDQPVPREEIVYFNHRLSADHGCRVEPLQTWSCTAESVRTWKKSWVEMQREFGHLVISNINVAGKFPPPQHRTVASQVKQSISTISRSLMGTPMRVIAGAFRPNSEPSYKDELDKYISGRKNVTLWNLE